LSVNEKRHLYEHGYVILQNVIPGRMVDEALRAINHSLGEGMEPAQMRVFRAQSFCPELRQDPTIVDLLQKSPVWSLAESALGEGQIWPVRGGQIALRFPVPADPPRPVGVHLDGMYAPDNGVPRGTIANFTALIGIFLSDVETEYAGNFSVVPGSHSIYEAYFRDHGAESLLQGMPPVDLPPVRQIRARAGDAVLCHYQLAHGVAQNTSPHVRYAIFFRLHHVDIDPAQWQAPMQDIWMHWPGIRSAVPEASGEATAVAAPGSEGY
jgi:hypothetical protein